MCCLLPSLPLLLLLLPLPLRLPLPLLLLCVLPPSPLPPVPQINNQHSLAAPPLTTLTRACQAWLKSWKPAAS